MSITFTRVTAANLAQADATSDSDPYVRWTCGGEITETHYLQNVLGRAGGKTPGSETTPKWDGEYTMDLPTNLEGGGLKVSVSLWDHDQFSADNFLGGVDFSFDVTREVANLPVNVELYDRYGHKAMGGGRVSTVSFVVTVELPRRARPSPPPPEDDAVEQASATKGPPPPVVRKDIRAMTPAEQQRYAAAVTHMMKNVDGVPESSPFFKLAGIHGWPGKGTERNYSYCEHRQETFPGWHRAYLCAFEEAMQRADKELGNDGRIGLPYWDVVGQPEVNGEVFPAILRSAFPNGTGVVRGMLSDPKGASPGASPAQERQRGKLWEAGYQIADDATLKRAVEQANLGTKARDTLWIAQHFRAASTFGSSNSDSIESPHDMIHVLSGYPMRSLMHAAFHPAFWLHHCNIDRLYEAYLNHNPHAQRQFESNQDRQRNVNQRHGRRDRYDEWLEPFYLPRRTKERVRFMPHHTFDIHALGYAYDALEPRPNQALTAPPVLASFENIDVNALPTGYTIFVFVYPDAAAAASAPMGPDLAALLDHPNLGGIGALFTGRADVCAECQNSEPFDMRVDITEGLRRLGLAAANATLACVVETADHEWLPISATPIPAPVIRGGNAPTRPRFDFEEEGGGAGGSTGGDAATYPPGTTVRYAVEEGPGELPRGRLLHEIAQMFSCWSGTEASGLSFERLPRSRAAEADLVVGWADHSTGNAARFDGPGGKLAEASKSSILLDASERWLLHGAGWGDYARTSVEPGAGLGFYVAPVLLHEIGHALGLRHSDRPSDVMYPMYSPARVELSEGDKARARAAYGVVASRPNAEDYLAAHRSELEEDLTAAVRDAISKRATRPLRHVAQLLLQQDAEKAAPS
jgi:hypothetical protein